MSHILTFTTLFLFLTYLTNAQLSLYATRDDDLIAGKRVSSPTWIHRTIAADDDAIYNPYQGMNGIRVAYKPRDRQRPLKQRKGKKPKKEKLLYADDDDIFEVGRFPWWQFAKTPEWNGPQYRNGPAEYKFNNPRAQTQALSDDDVFAGLVYGIPQQWNKPAEYKFTNPSTQAKTPSWIFNKLAIADDDVVAGKRAARNDDDAFLPTLNDIATNRPSLLPKWSWLADDDMVAGQRIGLFSFYDDDEIAGQRIDVTDDSDEARPYYVIEEQQRRGDDDHIAGVRAGYSRSNRRGGTTSTDDERIRINDPTPTFPLPKKPIWVDDDDEHIRVNYDGASYGGGKSANIIYVDDDLIAGQRADIFRVSDQDEIIRIQYPGKPIRPTYPVWTVGPFRPRSRPVYADDDEYTRSNYGGANYGGPVRPIWVDDNMIAGQRVLRG